jgi:hypothetical protein
VVLAAADGEPVVDSLDLQRRQLLEWPGADFGSDVVAQQRGVAGDGAGAQAGADMRQPTVQVLVDGELGRVEREPMGAAGQRVGQGVWVPESRSWVLNCEFAREVAGPR